MRLEKNNTLDSVPIVIRLVVDYTFSKFMFKMAC